MNQRNSADLDLNMNQRNSADLDLNMNQRNSTDLDLTIQRITVIVYTPARTKGNNLQTVYQFIGVPNQN